MKTCTACGKSKQLDDFPADKRNPDGRGVRCLACSLRFQKQIRKNLASIQGAPGRPASNAAPIEGRSVELPEHDDESRFVEPAVARWRAELEARRQAGIPDRDVDLQEPVKKTRPRRRTGFRFKHLAIIVSVLLIALLSDLAYVAVRLRSNLSSASSSLSQGREAIADSDLPSARNGFNRALRNARNANGLEGHPSLRTLGVLPWISNDARAVSVLASVAEIASLAGLEVTELYDRLGVVSGTNLVGALFEDGRVKLDSVALASQTVTQLVESLSGASTLANEDVEPHLGTLTGGLDRVRSELSDALGTLRRADTLLAAAPSLFAESAKSQYLLVIQNPSQSRSTGGSIDYYGILSAIDGKLRLGQVRPISTLEETDPEAWSLINRSVDFPDVAREIIERFEGDTGRRLDGVIASDTFVLEYMAKATGPVRAPGLDLAIGPDNARKVLMHDVFEYFGGRSDERDLYVAEIIEKIWSAVTEGIGDPSVLLDALNRSAREQHLKVYVSDPRSETAIDDLELSGDPTVFGPRVQTIAQNSLSSSRVDFFLRRDVDTRIELADDGSARVRTTITIENRAPEGPPSLVLGSGSRAGRASLSLQMLVPEGADHIFLSDRAGDTDKRVGALPLATTDVAIPPGAERKVILNYELPPPQVESTFEFVLLPAPLAFPDRASLHVFAPDGFCINSCEADPSPARWDRTTTLIEPLGVRARLVSVGE